MTAVAVAPVLVDARLAGRGRRVSSDLPSGARSDLESIDVALDRLLAVDAHDLGGRGAQELVLGLHRVAERAAAAVTTTLPRLDRDGRWALDDEATFVRWVARRLGMSVHAAGRRVRTGQTLVDHLPATAEAARAGDLGTEAAAVLAHAASSESRRAVLGDAAHGCNEAFLLRQATALPVDDVRAVVRVWADRADPDSDERGYREASEREHVTLARVPFGYRLDGQLTVEHGQHLRAALAALTPVPAVGDQRSAAQRRAQALSDLARTVLEHHPVAAGRVERPGVVVHVDYPTLARLVGDRGAGGGDAGGAAGAAEAGAGAGAGVGVGGEGTAGAFGPADLRRGAFFADGSAVPREVLDRLACDGALRRVVFGPQSEVIDAGRSRRVFTGPVRAAVVARDGHCAFPGCSAPPSIGEVHHVAHWARDGGRTDASNGVLLCYHHHELVHRRALRVVRTAGEWEVRDRSGTVLRR